MRRRVLRLVWPRRPLALPLAGARQTAAPISAYARCSQRKVRSIPVEKGPSIHMDGYTTAGYDMGCMALAV